MKIPLIALLMLVACACAIHGQSRRSKIPDPAFYVFDAGWKPTKLEKAVYMIVENKESDSSWRYDSYNLFGPLIKTERFKTKDGDIAQGEFIFYNKEGTIDSIQYYKNGLADLTWSYLNENGKVYLKKDFFNGRLIKTTDYLNKDTLARRKSAPKDSTTKRIEKMSEFDGGVAGWRAFLTKNFHYPQRAINKNIQGTVVVQFAVDAQGNIESPRITKSVEYSVDTETLRIMHISPRWTPAELNGKRLRSYKKQPITFKLQR